MAALFVSALFTPEEVTLQYNFAALSERNGTMPDRSAIFPVDFGADTYRAVPTPRRK